MLLLLFAYVVGQDKPPLPSPWHEVARFDSKPYYSGQVVSWAEKGSALIELLDENTESRRLLHWDSNRRAVRLILETKFKYYKLQKQDDHIGLASTLVGNEVQTYSASTGNLTSSIPSEQSGSAEQIGTCLIEYNGEYRYYDLLTGKKVLPPKTDKSYDLKLLYASPKGWLWRKRLISMKTWMFFADPETGDITNRLPQNEELGNFVTGAKGGGQLPIVLSSQSARESWDTIIRRNGNASLANSVYDVGPHGVLRDDLKPFSIRTPGHLVCEDSETGKVLWKSQIETQDSPDAKWCGPFVEVEYRNEVTYLNGNTGAIIYRKKFDPKDRVFDVSPSGTIGVKFDKSGLSVLTRTVSDQ